MTTSLRNRTYRQSDAQRRAPFKLCLRCDRELTRQRRRCECGCERWREPTTRELRAFQARRPT